MDTNSVQGTLVASGAWRHLEGVPVTCAGGKQGLRMPVANLEKPNLQAAPLAKGAEGRADEPLSGRALARTPLLGVVTSLPEPFTVCPAGLGTPHSESCNPWKGAERGSPWPSSPSS